ncbi:hypothetical protein V3C99_002186 [Haemonchus contortus]|uniref:XK-related protein n=1 Tax=Haemonchus contortus TaxID=6289 RepID=A0A7I4YD13_HAECO
MEKLRRFRESLFSIQPKVVAEVAVRLSIATVVNYYLSQFLFCHKTIPVIENLFQTTSLVDWMAFRLDPDRLPKMYRLWPPHSHIGITAMFTVTLYILLKYFMTPDHVWQLLGRRARSEEEKESSQLHRPCSVLVARLLSASVVALTVFVLLLPMQRLAEMHIFVIVLNFLHVFLVCELSSIIMFLFTGFCTEKIKEE